MLQTSAHFALCITLARIIIADCFELSHSLLRAEMNHFKHFRWSLSSLSWGFRRCYPHHRHPSFQRSQPRSRNGLPVSGSPHGQFPWPPSKLARLRKPFQGPDNSDSPTAPTAPTPGESYGLWKHVTNKHRADTPVSDLISSSSIVVKLWTNQEFGIKLYQCNSMCNLSNSSVSNFVVPLQCRSRLLTVQESVKRLRSGLGILENRTTCDLWQNGVCQISLKNPKLREHQMVLNKAADAQQQKSQKKRTLSPFERELPS